MLFFVELDYPRRTLQTAEIKNKRRLATSFGIQVSHNPLSQTVLKRSKVNFEV
jgi:hypothetical protein